MFKGRILFQMILSTFLPSYLSTRPGCRTGLQSHLNLFFFSVSADGTASEISFWPRRLFQSYFWCPVNSRMIFHVEFTWVHWRLWSWASHGSACLWRGGFFHVLTGDCILEYPLPVLRLLVGLLGKPALVMEQSDDWVPFTLCQREAAFVKRGQ